MVANRFSKLMMVAALIGLSGCRGTTPEEVGPSVAGFAGDVLYNSAGAQNQANRENPYPQPCQQCQGLGHHSGSPDTAEQTECHACMGRGWN